MVSSASPELLEGITILQGEQTVEYQEHLSVILQNS